MVPLKYMGSGLSPDATARDFTESLGINLNDSTTGLGRVAVRLVPLDNLGHTAQHVTDDYGTDFYAARVDFKRGDNTVASQSIAIINSRAHTKFAYWPESAKPQKIAIHQGEGYFIVGDPRDEEFEGMFSTHYYNIDATVTPYVTLPPGTIYTLEAAPGSTLVVSAVSEVNGDTVQEVPVEPGNPVIHTPDGDIDVPEEFVTAKFE